MSGKGKTSNLLDTATRRAFVLANRRAGMTYAQIAEAALKHFGPDQLPNGWDERYAYKDVKRELDRLNKEIAESASDVLRLELERLDEMQRAIWVQVKRGDYKGIDRALRVMDRRAKLLGLDAPVKSELSGPDGGPIQVEDAKERLESRINSIAARSETADNS